MRRAFLLVLPAMLAGGILASAAEGCSRGTSGSGGGGGGTLPEGGADSPHDTYVQPDAPIFDGSMDGSFCTLPGSFRNTAKGPEVVAGGTGPDLLWLRLPVGFCAHWFGNVGNGRQLRFAPGGELFVASPTTSTTSGGPNGKAAIIILPDDNKDGYADAPITFMSNLPSTQGLLFANNGYFYYQDDTRIMRLPYKAGDRAPSGAGQQVANITLYDSNLHWPKPIDQADDGTIYVGNGGDQGEVCDPALPFHGGILKVDGTPGGTPVARGFRNPIGVRCARGHNQCFAVELAKDYSANENGREKLVPIRQGDDWGFPCCATKDLPYLGLNPVPNCSGVSAESDAFFIGNTPFDVDFEPNKWPLPWAGNAVVPLHGAASTWTGARVVAIRMDPNTGLPLYGSDLSGMSTGGMVDLATGWDDMSFKHGRPTAVTFAADGRLFLSNDNNGDIIWIAPLTL